ncbi:hypothetical protein JIQ42_08115 [Leishmania sp. Namibia]|uniref:hypothetical protein n=1 Tax=Leishmania sp. Namibia TaxID=2802991 RepID=UPI001B691D77|nr:hypothetical protein JIQ42_08115 [Leishmania sp. Namibia]
MKSYVLAGSVGVDLRQRAAPMHRCLGFARAPVSAAGIRAKLSCSISARFRSASASSAAQQEREAAWIHFVAASRQLRRLVHKGASSAQPRASPFKSAESAEQAFASSAVDIDGDDDEALALMAPDIVRQTSTTASNAALMRELGVLDRVEGQAAAKVGDVKESAGASTDNGDAAADVTSLTETSPWLLSVCRTGIQAQVSGFVILRHLWRPFAAAPAAARTPRENSPSKAGDEPLCIPTMAWAASLPASVRLLLLSHELQRVHRRRRYAAGGLQGNVRVATEGFLHDVGQTPVHALSEMWAQTVQESRAVVLSCCAPWLLHYSAPASNSNEGSDSLPPFSRVFFSPLERHVLDAGVKLCAVCQAEDVARALMAIFIRGADRCATGPSGQSADTAAVSDETAFKAWYNAEAGTLYESAMAAAAAPRTHASLFTSCVYSTGSDGFPLAYSYLIHRGVTSARLSAASGEDGDSGEVSVALDILSSSLISGRCWSASLSQEPRCAMRLVRALAIGVEANADHFNIVLQLYLRLVEETDAGYNSDSVEETRLAFCAVLNSLARVPLEAKTYMSVLEDVHRRTLVRTASDVTQHPDVLASCLRVCSAAGVPNRAVTLFNKLCEPSSRALAVEERNVAAVLLSTPDTAATLQRLLSFMHTKLPVTADTVHTAAARALIADTKLLCSDSSTVFGLFDLLEIQLAAEHRVTHHTAVLCADRTFFLRVLTVLAGVHEQRDGGSGVRELLSTPAAAAVFRQWIASAVQHQPCKSSWASTLSPVTVGVLQELDLELRRAAQADSRVRDNSTPAAPLGSLLAAVEEVLEAASGTLPPSIRPIRSVSGDAVKDRCVLYSLPDSLQWRQLQAEWQLEEQKRFLDGASRLLIAPTAGETAATSCVRYQDWAVLHELWRKCARVTSQEHLTDAWAKAASKRLRQPKAAVSTPSPTFQGVAADRAALCVLTPLAEVEWWLLQDSACPRDTSSMAVVSLSDRLGVTVPPAVGCPTHTWATDPAAALGRARDRRTKVVAYWLQRWVDCVEDGRVLPWHSLFRTSVVRLLQTSASAVRVAAEKGDAAEHIDGRDSLSGSPGRRRTPSAPHLVPGKVEKSGVEAMLVRGPSSLVYTT